jgi:hypothetical protein
MSAVKHSYEKVGDHWEPKRRKGPSDERAAKGRSGGGRSAGGVDVRGHSRNELYERARKLGVKGRSSMNKQELAEAIARKQDWGMALRRSSPERTCPGPIVCFVVPGATQQIGECRCGVVVVGVG